MRIAIPVVCVAVVSTLTTLDPALPARSQLGSSRIAQGVPPLVVRLMQKYGLTAAELKQHVNQALYNDAILYCTKKLVGESVSLKTSQFLVDFESTQLNSRNFWLEVRQIPGYGEQIKRYISTQYRGGCLDVLDEWQGMLQESMK